jgi:predicted nucleotidyltransferase
MCGRAMPAAQCLLVGAMARDLWLYYAHGIATGRATTDVDVAVAVASWADFDSLRETLIASGSFRSTGVVHRLQHASERRVDLIPFGQVAGADGILAWPPDGAVKMSIAGYDEAWASAVSVPLAGRRRCRHGYAAGARGAEDSRMGRSSCGAAAKDAYDLYLILRHYLDAGNADRLYRDHASWMKQGDFDYGEAGARLAGLDVRDLLRHHGANPIEIIEGLRRIVEPQTDPEGPNRLVGELREDAESFREHLMAFLQGLLDVADRREPIL